MSTLIRWDPFREVQTFRQMMDRMMDESNMGGQRAWPQAGDGFPLALDVAEDQDKYIVKASIPGVDPNNIDITLTDNVLTIKGETRQEKDVDEKNYQIRERRYGSFTRSIALPAGVDPEKVEAIHEHGVLTLHLPKTEAVKPKKIAVKGMIDSQSTAGNEQRASKAK
jgi:HSP20 family protein